MKKLFIVLLVFAAGCKNDSKTVQVFELVNKDSLFNEYLMYYINLDSVKQPVEDEYYNAYFFKKDNKDYFTLWHWNQTPVLIGFHNPDKRVSYYNYNLKGHNILLIKNDEEFDNFPEFINFPIDSVSIIDLVKMPKGEKVWDFIRIDSYELRNDSVDQKFVPADTVYFDFMGETGQEAAIYWRELRKVGRR